RRTIQRHRLCAAGSRVLIGLSGGSDSVALVLIMRELSEHGGFGVVGLAHLNHRLRATSDRDEAFCRTFADAIHLPIEVESRDVAGYAAAQRLSVEDAARRLRYDFLHRAAVSTRADTVAVGHTRDDQAETLLLKLVRGAGLTGLAGIHPRRGEIVRPLLDVSRLDLRAFLEARGQTWVDDETNEDLDNPRNRIRHLVVPELNRTYPSATSAIARTAGLLREDGQWLDEVSRRRYEALVSRTSAGPQMDAHALLAEPSSVARRGGRMALRCDVS